jgi:hypothetical protein
MKLKLITNYNITTAGRILDGCVSFEQCQYSNSIIPTALHHMQTCLVLTVDDRCSILVGQKFHHSMHRLSSPPLNFLCVCMTGDCGSNKASLSTWLLKRPLSRVLSSSIWSAARYVVCISEAQTTPKSSFTGSSITSWVRRGGRWT